MPRRPRMKLAGMPQHSVDGDYIKIEKRLL